MSGYHCDNCGNLEDDDENPCHESPLSIFGLICDYCYIENSVDGVWDAGFINYKFLDNQVTNPHMGRG